MGCHTWWNDLKIPTDITKTKANQEVIRLLKESDNEIDKECLENYIYLHNYETFVPKEHRDKSYYCELDAIYIETNEMEFYPIFRVGGYPEFVLKSADDIQILKEFVSNGGKLWISSSTVRYGDFDRDFLDTDFNSDKWKVIEQNINELYQSYPDLLIRFG